MKRFTQNIIIALAAALLAACSNISMPSLASLGGGSDTITTKQDKNQAPLLRYAASIHLNAYVDGRHVDNPRKIGTGGEFVSGMNGKDIILDQTASNLVTRSIKSGLDNAGFQINELQGGTAQFELTGTIKQLAYDVKARDEVAIVIESTVTEVATGKVIWSGVVEEKNSRFAGVSGDNQNDVASYLHKELTVVTQKTIDAISNSLVAVHPELFNLTPGSRPIPGVTVLVAPTVPTVRATAVPLGAAPAPVPGVISMPESTYTPHASDTAGLLLVNTNPPRARVYLDDVYYGLSPLRLELDPGVHYISVKLTGYKMVSEKVSVRKGDSTEMDLDLEH